MGGIISPSHQLFHGFPFTDDMKLVPIDHDFGSAGTGIVVRTHAHAIGSGGHDGKQVSFRQGQLPVMPKKIPVSQTGPTT